MNQFGVIIHKSLVFLYFLLVGGLFGAIGLIALSYVSNCIIHCSPPHLLDFTHKCLLSLKYSEFVDSLSSLHCQMLSCQKFVRLTPSLYSRLLQTSPHQQLFLNYCLPPFFFIPLLCFFVLHSIYYYLTLHFAFFVSHMTFVDVIKSETLSPILITTSSLPRIVPGTILE